jgi:hypothetical protein
MYVVLLRKYAGKQFYCGHILTEGVFVTELSGDAGISVWRGVCKFRPAVTFQKKVVYQLRPGRFRSEY